MPMAVTLTTKENQVRVHVLASLRPGQDMVELSCVQRQVFPTVLAYTSSLLE